MVKTIRIYAKRIKMENNVSFMKYSYTKDGNVFYDVRFGTEVKNAPQEVGYYLVEADTNDIRIRKGKAKEGSNYEPNDIIRVYKTLSVNRDTEYEKERETERLRKLTELLG